MRFQIHRAVNPPEGKVIDHIAKRRNGGVFPGIQDDEKTVPFSLHDFGNIDPDWEIAGDMLPKVISVKVDVDLQHRPIETEDMDGEIIFQIEDLLVGEKALVRGFIEIIGRHDLHRMGEVDGLLALWKGGKIAFLIIREEAPREIQCLFHIGYFSLDVVRLLYD